MTYADIIGVSPYGNYIVTKQVTGAALTEIMETSLDIGLQSAAANASGKTDAWPENSGSYLQFGGMTVTYDPTAAKGSRVLSIEVQGAPLESDKIYTVATNNFVAVSENYPQLAQTEETGQFIACDEALVRFFQQDADAIAASVYDERLITDTAAQDDSDVPPPCFPTCSKPTGSTKRWISWWKTISCTAPANPRLSRRVMSAAVWWRLCCGGWQTVCGHYQMPYNDIASDTYYTEAVRWASSEQIVTGYDEQSLARKTRSPVSSWQPCCTALRRAKE